MDIAFVSAFLAAMLRLAKTSLLLLVFSLAFMKPNVAVGRLLATGTDLLFLLCAGLFGLAVLRGRARLRWHPFYAVLLIYFAAMALSVLASEQPGRSLFKLATLAYLISLPVLCDWLIDSRDDLRAIVRTWLAASAVPAVLGLLAVVLLAAGIHGSPLDFARHEFGSLPPGNYTRLEGTFRHPAMLCNYLSVSLMVLFAAWRAGWVGRTIFHGLLAAILFTSMFTLTPGLGGVFLALGLLGYLCLRPSANVPAFACLALGTLAAAFFVAAAAVTPILHPTTPYLIEVPLLAVEVAPSARLMAWADAANTFLKHPLLGSGIGTGAANVHYIDPSGHVHDLADAHNVFLNVAAESGLVGLAALSLLIANVIRLTGRLQLDTSRAVRLLLGLGWLIAFAYEGLTGSYEDARHLWVLLGLILASARLEAGRCATGGDAAPVLNPSDGPDPRRSTGASAGRGAL